MALASGPPLDVQLSPEDQQKIKNRAHVLAKQMCAGKKTVLAN